MSELVEPIDVRWVEFTATRDINASNFGNGLQDFAFDVQQPEVWFPSRTYMRHTYAVSGAAGANLPVQAAIVQPTIEQQIALAENCVSNCYTAAVFKVESYDISSITQNYPQASALEYRINNSGTWADRLGSYAMAWNGDRSSRVAAISKTTTDPIVGRNALTGINLNEGKEEFYRPTDGKTPDLATISAADGATAISMAGGALISAADAGCTLVINGRRHTILGVNTGPPVTVNVGSTFTTAAGTAFAATNDWYLIRRNTRYSTQARNVQQIISRPSALGIFRYKGALGAGRYRLQLTPDINYQKTCVELPYGAPTGYGPLTEANMAYSVAITDVRIFVCVAKMKYDILELPLRLTEFEVIPRPMAGLQHAGPGRGRRLYQDPLRLPSGHQCGHRQPGSTSKPIPRVRHDCHTGDASDRHCR